MTENTGIPAIIIDEDLLIETILRVVPIVRRSMPILFRMVSMINMISKN
jgi:hypothetical protein